MVAQGEAVSEHDTPETIDLAPRADDDTALLWRTVRRIGRAHHDHKHATLVRFGAVWLALALGFVWLVVLTVAK